jgi:hypothetical protein
MTNDQWLLLNLPASWLREDEIGMRVAAAKKTSCHRTA